MCVCVCVIKQVLLLCRQYMTDGILVAWLHACPPVCAILRTARSSRTTLFVYMLGLFRQNAVLMIAAYG